jgi:hydroxylamine reductase
MDANMFCYQCQEAAKGTGCEIKGVCGKEPETSALQDLLLHTAKGVSIVREVLKAAGKDTAKADFYVMESLFVTITNANFDYANISERIIAGLELQ